jgi:hypothetical protein
MCDIDNFTACDLLFTVYRWVDNGFDPACCDTNKLYKVFSSNRCKELKKYFIKYPLVRQQFQSWLKKILADSETIPEMSVILSDLFSAREKDKFRTLIKLCDTL